jgi:hypothetical protein
MLETPSLLGPLERANPFRWTRPCFRNIVYSSPLEFRAVEKVQKSSGYECYTPSPKPFGFIFYPSSAQRRQTESQSHFTSVSYRPAKLLTAMYTVMVCLVTLSAVQTV